MAGYQPGMNASDDFPGTGDNIGPGIGEDSFLNLTARESRLPLLVKRGTPVPSNLSPAQALRLQETGSNQVRTTAGEELLRFHQMSREERAALQARLFAAGLYSDSYYKAKNPKMYQPGVADEDSYAAYHKAVRRAVLSGSTIDEILGTAAEAGGGAGGTGATRAPLTISLTNPTDIHFVANKVGQTVLGRLLTDDELNSITKAFQGQEAASQRAAYNTGAGGGTSTQAPSAQAFAEQQLKAQHPLEAQGNQFLDTFNSFLGLIGSK